MLKMSQRAVETRTCRAGIKPKATDQYKLLDKRISDLEWQMNFAKIALRNRASFDDRGVAALLDLHDTAALQLTSVKNH